MNLLLLSNSNFGKFYYNFLFQLKSFSNETNPKRRMERIRKSSKKQNKIHK
jgi:hypothetical protein